MFVEEAEAAYDNRFVLRNVHAGVKVRLEYHRAELKHGVPLVFQPCVALHAGVVAGLVLAVLGRVGQPEVLQLFTERRPAVAPVVLGARLGGGQKAQVRVELGGHHVRVAALQHRPVDEPLVLCGHRSASPLAVIGREGRLRVYVNGVEREQSAVELRRPLAVSVAAQHVAEQLVVAHSPLNFPRGGAFACLVCLLTVALGNF